MRSAYLTIAFLLASALPGHAQVINGESTYEDNFHHTPPPDATAKPQTDPAAAKAPAKAVTPAANDQDPPPY